MLTIHCYKSDADALINSIDETILIKNGFYQLKDSLYKHDSIEIKLLKKIFKFSNNNLNSSGGGGAPYYSEYLILNDGTYINIKYHDAFNTDNFFNRNELFDRFTATVTVSCDEKLKKRRLLNNNKLKRIKGPSINRERPGGRPVKPIRKFE